MSQTKTNGKFLPTAFSDLLENDSFFKPFFPGFDGGLLDTRLTSRIPSVNITENGKDYKIELAAPGLEKKDFKIDVDNGTLTVAAEKREEKKEEHENYRRKEFSYNSFSRSFQLPENSLPEKIEAKYENGVLKLCLPKKEVATSKPKKEIKIA